MKFKILKKKNTFWEVHVNCLHPLKIKGGVLIKTLFKLLSNNTVNSRTCKHVHESLIYPTIIY